MHSATATQDFSIDSDPKIQGTILAKRAGMYSGFSIDYHRLKHSMTSLPVCAAAALASVIIMAMAEVSGFSRGDAFALCGTAFAIVVVLIGIRQLDKSLKNGASVISGTVIFGICSPALIVRYFNSGADDTAYRFVDWQIWVLLGFVCGLAGWSITQALYSFFTKYVPEALPAFLRRFIFGKNAPDHKSMDNKPPSLPDP